MLPIEKIVKESLEIIDALQSKIASDELKVELKASQLIRSAFLYQLIQLGDYMAYIRDTESPELSELQRAASQDGQPLAKKFTSLRNQILHSYLYTSQDSTLINFIRTVSENLSTLKNSLNALQEKKFGTYKTGQPPLEYSLPYPTKNYLAVAYNEIDKMLKLITDNSGADLHKFLCYQENPTYEHDFDRFLGDIDEIKNYRPALTYHLNNIYQLIRSYHNKLNELSDEKFSHLQERSRIIYDHTHYGIKVWFIGIHRTRTPLAHPAAESLDTRELANLIIHAANSKKLIRQLHKVLGEIITDEAQPTPERLAQLGIERNEQANVLQPLPNEPIFYEFEDEYRDIPAQEQVEGDQDLVRGHRL